MKYYIKDDSTEVLFFVSENTTIIRVEDDDLDPYELELNTTDLDDIASAVQNALNEKNETK